MGAVKMDELKEFAKQVYEALAGRECPIFMDANQLGIPADFVEQAIDYWVEEGVMKRMGLGTAEVCLTHEGAAEIRSWSS